MYFVGRRLFEASEVYAVTASNVERLRSRRRYGEPSLDWRGSRAARLELSDILISRVAKGRPTRKLEERFSLYVLDQLPDGGFVLDSDDIWGWLRLASDSDDFAPARSERRSWLRSLFGANPGVSADA